MTTRLVRAEAAASPVDRDAFAAALAPLIDSTTWSIAAAVSGGADSLALVLLLDDWCREHAVTLTALTVDHRLRPESTGEARQVGAWLAARGIVHQALAWDDAEKTRRGGLQAAARAARYRLLEAWCLRHGVETLAVGHHAEDQVETFLMRLARGSGLEGLTAMAPRQRVGRLTVLRPLLGFDKAQLVATCAAARQPWIEDPSNADDRHARVRFRRARAFLAAEGLTDRRLLSTIGHLSRAQAAIDASVETLRLSSTARDEFGVFTLSVAALLAAPEDVALRLLARVLAEAGGSAYAPRYESLAQLDARLRRGENFTATVAGCIVNRSSGVVRLAREPAAIDGEVAIGPGDSVVWDGRFRLTRRAAATATQAPMTVAALRNEHWIRIKALPGARPLVDLPARVRLTLPVICRRETLIGVPHAQLWFDDETRDAVTVAWSAHPADDPITGIERE